MLISERACVVRESDNVQSEFVLHVFSGVDIKGVCWRNWIAHLTTEDYDLCTVCCHQEVPGSSPG